MFLKAKLNKALAQDDESDSDLNIKRKRKDSSSDSDSDHERKIEQMQKKQKMNQHKTAFRNEHGQIVDVSELTKNVDRQAELKELQEA